MSSDDVEGGGFGYGHCPEVFLGRIGTGPLRLAWDTNILIDYGQYGSMIWEDEPFLPAVEDDEYRLELVALEQLMQIWMTRDLRIRVPERQIADAGRRMEPETRRARIQQIGQLRQALVCVGLDLEIDEAGVEARFASIPQPSKNDDWDLSLVMEANDSGCHVFLTRDKGLLSKRNRFAEWWVNVMTPKMLLDALSSAGEGAIASNGAPILMPDTHKWQHVMAAHCG